MSKIDFSKKMSDSLRNKILSFIQYEPNSFFKYDEDFELALCISYMTLTKEKIIDKDKKNWTSKTGRLTSKVDAKEIEKVFDTSFCNDVPNIIFTAETDKTWILDNIRDCIMHGLYEVDENKKCFILNNKQNDRELRAEIPFSWFVAYTKYDILSKKISNNYTMKGFYYNIDRNNIGFYKTSSEVFNNIMYRIDITGTNFNIDEITTKIRNLMTQMSTVELSDNLIAAYKDTYPHKFKYSDRYLASFAIASKYIKDSLEKEYPGLNINIKLDDKKYSFLQKVEKHLSKSYQDYDLLMRELDYGIRRKSYELISYIQKMLTNINVPFMNQGEYENGSSFNETLIQFTNRFDGLVGEDLRFSDNINRFKSVSELLLNILINVYGITTLAANEDIYISEFENILPKDMDINVTKKQPIREYEEKQKNFLEQILNIKIKIYKMKQRYAVSPSKQLSKDIKKLEDKLRDKEQKMNVIGPQRVNSPEYYREYEKLKKLFDNYMDHFKKADDIAAKERIRDCILRIYDAKVKNDINYSNAISTSMKDALVVIRDSFSHIGRIYVGKNFGLDTTIIMRDYYDNEDLESGCVILKLSTLLDILEKPLGTSKNGPKL